MTVGFFVCIKHRNRTWIDDLCVDDPSRWPVVIETLKLDERPWTTFVAIKDLDRLSALNRADASCLSRYWVRSTSGVAAGAATGQASVEVEQRLAALSTWTVEAQLSGSLVVGDDEGGYVVGSPSMSPPIYDPGRSTCVIDQVVGKDREGLIIQTLAASTERGDAQLVVVCGDDDSDLARILEAQGFSVEVCVIRSRRARPDRPRHKVAEG